MIDPAILRAMQASGCTTEQIIAVVEAVAGKDEERKAAKRANNAERQRRHKAKITQGNADNALPASCGVNNGQGSLKETSPTPPKEIHLPIPPVIPSGMTAPVVENEIVELKPEHVIEAWNDLARRHGLPLAAKMTDARQKHLKTFVRRNSIDEVLAGLTAIERSGFLRGENDRGWRADIDFFLQPKSFAKLIEGAYDH